MGSKTIITRYWTSFVRFLGKHISNENPFVYVALGDSTVAGVGASRSERSYTGLIYTHLQELFQFAVYHNFGKSGARISDVRKDQLEPAIAAAPALITLSVGANDILKRTPVKTFRRRLTALISDLQGQTKALIVITNVPNFSLLPAIPRSFKTLAKYRIKRFNAVIDTVAASHNLILIDAYHYTGTFTRQFSTELVYTDGFHPSDFGYALWANMILIALRDKLEALRQPRHRHRFLPHFS